MHTVSTQPIKKKKKLKKETKSYFYFMYIFYSWEYLIVFMSEIIASFPKIKCICRDYRRALATLLYSLVVCEFL